MRKILLLSLLLFLLPSPTFAAPIASNMVTEVDGEKIKSLNGILFETEEGIKLLPNNKFKKFTKEYTVSFKSNNKILKKDKVLKGDSANAPILRRKGYNFIGWDKDFSSVKNNLTVNAIWEAKKYNIAFKDGSEILKTDIVEYGKKAIPPELTNEEEKIFVKWDKPLTVKEDTVYNAIWKAKEYTVTFIDELNNSKTTVNVEYSKDSFLPPNPTYPSYIFIGWNNDGKNIVEDTEIKAIWKKDNNLIQYLPKACDNSVKIKGIENWIIDTANGNSTQRYYADYSLLEKARKNVNAKYFHYFSMLDSSISSENGKFYIEVNPCKDRIEKNKYIKDKVEEIAKEVMPEGMREREGIERLQNWFKNNMQYLQGEHLLYNSLKKGKGNCDAYSQIAQAVCDYAGIECKYVTGYVDSGYHAWNKVKIEGEWYYIDFTWNYPLSKNLWNDHKEESSYFPFS